MSSAVSELRIAHVADIHFRGIQRHNEYKIVLKSFFKECRKLNVNHIVIAGDSWHTKTQGITPEAISLMSWFFRECSKVAQTHVMLGNHDLNMQNVSRQNIISSLLGAMYVPRVRVYADSGVYDMAPGVKLCVYSVADEHDSTKWDAVKPVPGNINIACFHGSVSGAKSDDGWVLESETSVDFFKGYDFVLLGDTHKRQFLVPDRRVAYSGSIVSQNYSEIDDRGFLFWKIRSKDDFDVTPIDIVQPNPHVTIDWAGSIDSTLERVKESRPGTRFRVKSDELIPQSDIRRLHDILKHDRSASEVVYKIDHSIDADVVTANGYTFFKDDLRDPVVHVKLLNEFFKGGLGIDEEMMESIVARALDSARVDDNTARNSRVSLKRIEWENTFSYGKGNVIDLAGLDGITGIFAPNKSGKSSIVGTLMYCLFNTTDRGSMKNLHIINTSKGHCKARVDLSINGDDYYIERQTVRRENKKKGEIYATTNVNFAMIDGTIAESDDENEEVINDLNGEQRSGTDANIRDAIGMPEDMLLTSIVAQAGPIRIDRFLDAGSTDRRAILSRFLGLEIFDRMFEIIKPEADLIRNRFDRFIIKDWDAEAATLMEKCAVNQDEIDRIDSEMTLLRSELVVVESELARIDTGDIVTRDDVARLEHEIVQNERLVSDATAKLSSLGSERLTLIQQLKSLNAQLKGIDIDELHAIDEHLTKLERELNDMQHSEKAKATAIDGHASNVKRLDVVPCGDKYPTCSYIKNAHESKAVMASIVAEHAELSRQLRDLNARFSATDHAAVKQQLRQHGALTDQKMRLEKKLSDVDVGTERVKSRVSALRMTIDNLNDEKARTEKNVIDVSLGEALANLRSRKTSLGADIETHDTTRLNAANSKGRAQGALEQLNADRLEYDELKKQWSVYEKLRHAWSKRGIPAQIIASQVPAINLEISQILHGTTDFVVKLDATDATTMDVYIDDGSSKRLFELSSGMERFIGSLALRIALLNVSTLPKIDVLVIDEGFGTLDELNTESVSRMLVSLKRWFKSILLITHVDALKDIVDNIIDVTKDETGCSHVEC